MGRGGMDCITNRPLQEQDWTASEADLSNAFNDLIDKETPTSGTCTEK
jgi:hypothetical protein